MPMHEGEGIDGEAGPDCPPFGGKGERSGPWAIALEMAGRDAGRPVARSGVAGVSAYNPYRLLPASL